jgi:hypothetical protein
MRTITGAALAGALVLSALITASATQAETSTARIDATALTRDAETGAALAAWDCDLGDVCFYTGFGGTGSRCAWDVADPDWTSGSIRCSWATTTPVKSVYNRGTDSRFTGVVFYRNTGYNNRIGCTRQGQKGDLAGTYQVRSHQWTTGNCG